MKTTETQQKVLDYLEKFNDSTAESVASGTGLNKLLVFKMIKILSDEGLVKISDTKPSTYKIVKAESKSVKASDKKIVKVDAVKKVADDEVILKSSGRDTSKLKFQNELFSKGRVILAIIHEHIKRNPKITISKLREQFPDNLQPRYSVVQELSKGRKISEDRDRYFMKESELFKLADGKRYCCTNQWGSHNIDGILKVAKALGYKVTPE